MPEQTPEPTHDQNFLTLEHSLKPEPSLNLKRFNPSAGQSHAQAASAPGPISPVPAARKPATPFPAPQTSLPAGPSGGQSPMPGWLHWLESTAVPSTHSVFDPAPQASSEAANRDLPESDAALLHDARSMVTALDLYCDLLAEPGVLHPAFQHYAEELRLIAASSRRLLSRLDRDQPEPLVLSEAGRREDSVAPSSAPGPRLVVSTPARQRFALREPIQSLADELMAIRNLLAALAGPAITLGLSLDGGYRGIRMASDDLTRLMVNLIRNSTDAMPEGGHIQITLREHADRLRLTVTDSGCGLPEGDCEAVFAPGYTTHLDLAQEGGSEEAAHRGMGLAIARSLVAAAGGSIRAANRPGALADADEEASTGAVFEMEFPLAE